MVNQLAKDFKALSDELELSKTHSIDEKLERLKAWCQAYVSSDIDYSGDVDDAYEKCRELATVYLEDFLPEVPEDVAQIVPLFEGKTALEVATSNGFDRFIASLSNIKDAINTPNRYGMSLLHVAASNGFVNTVSQLLAQGANPMAENSQGQLAIHSALFVPMLHDDDLIARKIDIFRQLQKSVPNSVLKKDGSDNTVMHLMASQGFSSLLDDLMKSNPGLISIPNSLGHYPIHTAILNDKKDCVELLLSNDAVSSQKDNKERTALHYAGRYANKEIVALCAKKTSELDTRDYQGHTPLMLAVLGGNLQAVQALIGSGANSELTDGQGNGLMHLAVTSGNLATLTWLVEHTNLDINLQNNDKQSPLAFCDVGEPKETLKSFLQEQGATNNARLGM
jgi:uncharacterized protein